MARGFGHLYVGTNRHVAALDPRTGADIWRTKLPGGGAGGPPVSILIKGPSLYVGCYGHVYRLDRRDGTIQWDNGLPRMGYHTVLLAMEGADGGTSPVPIAAAEERRRRQQRSAGT